MGTALPVGAEVMVIEPSTGSAVAPLELEVVESGKMLGNVSRSVTVDVTV
jgi:hypothetical protein